MIKTHLIKQGFIALAVSLVAFTGGTASAQKAEHVVLITIDGSRPDFYLDPSWPAPHLQALAKEGTHAYGVNSMFPSMTYPSHTAIVTGVWPVRHGIYYNSMFEPDGPTGKIYWNDSSIHVPTVWGAAQAKGLKVASLFWPVSADAPVLYNIPDIGSLGEQVREEYSRPAGFVDTLRKTVFSEDGVPARSIDYGKDHNVARIAAYVIGKDQPNLMTIHFFSVDHYSHMQGRTGDSVRRAVADADSSVGIIIDALKKAGIWDKTVLIVTGDHGFETVTTSVEPNVWLAKAGLISGVKAGEWKAQFYSVGGSSYLYLRDRNDKATLQTVKDILAQLPPEEKQYVRVISRKEMDAVGGNPEVEFALSGLKGASFGNALTGPAVKPGHGGSHGYYPDFREIQTGFIAVGPGIRKGGEIRTMNLRDIAPVIAQLLGLDLPTVDGKVPAGLLK